MSQSQDSPKFRRSLSDRQIYLLKLLYKFRFATIELLASTNSKAASETMRQRLQVLVEQEYIGRIYDSSYRLLNKPARFHLKPKAIQALKDQPGLAWNVLHNAYKDKSAGPVFIEHCLKLFALYRHLQALHGDGLQFYTKSELAAYDHFPEKLPDAFMIVNNQPYFLDIVEADTPNFTVRRRLQSYIQHCEDGDWPQPDYPALLLVCDTPGQERRLQRLSAKLLVTSEVDELAVYTSTYKALMQMEASANAIWSDIEDPDEPLSLF